MQPLDARGPGRNETLQLQRCAEAGRMVCAVHLATATRASTQADEAWKGICKSDISHWVGPAAAECSALGVAVKAFSRWLYKGWGKREEARQGGGRGGRGGSGGHRLPSGPRGVLAGAGQPTRSHTGGRGGPGQRRVRSKAGCGHVEPGCWHLGTLGTQCVWDRCGGGVVLSLTFRAGTGGLTVYPGARGTGWGHQP